MSVESVRFQHRLEYAGWKSISGLLKLLPRRQVVLLADVCGWFMYSVVRLRRRIIDENLQIAFGSTMSVSERKKTGLRTWQNIILTFFEFLNPHALLTPGWEKKLEMEGASHLEALRGKQGIFLTAHLGNWEMLGTLCGQLGIPLAVVAKPMHNPLITREIVRERERNGIQVLLVQTSMKGIVDAIRRGKWIGFLADQDARRTGIFIDFFGLPASTAEGPALFSWKMNLPLLPAFCVRTSDRNRERKLVLLPPVMPDPAAPREQEVLRITKAHVHALEQVISAHPADYMWLHRRWKTRPKGSKQKKARLY